MRSSIIDLQRSPRSGAGAFAGLAAAYAQYGFDLVSRRVPIRNEIRCRDKRADISFSWRAPHTPTLAAARIDRSTVTRREHPRRPDLSATRLRDRTRLGTVHPKTLRWRWVGKSESSASKSTHSSKPTPPRSRSLGCLAHSSQARPQPATGLTALQKDADPVEALRETTPRTPIAGRREFH